MPGFDVWNSLIRRRLFSRGVNLSSALQWGGQIGTGFSGALRIVTVSLPMSERRLLNTVALKNVTTDFISINGFCQARNTAQKKGNVFSRYISLSMLRWKNDDNYCHAVRESVFFCSQCWVPVLSRRVCVCVRAFGPCVWEDGCVCERWTSCGSSTHEGHGGEVWAARRWVGRTLPSRGEQWGGDIQTHLDIHVYHNITFI